MILKQRKETNTMFTKELETIEDTHLREFTRYALANAPKYFYTIGASSSGKYHPKFSQGEGGLVRHTKAVLKFCNELLNMSPYYELPTMWKDYARVACLLHDICKYGETEEMDKTQYTDHAINGSIYVDKMWGLFHSTEEEIYLELAPELITHAIMCHMGRWSEQNKRPISIIDNLVHLADYVASRNFIDVDFGDSEPISEELPTPTTINLEDLIRD